jgi:NAD(P)-dependent dehydrogenase (short-subunit alcohol dehydrogenase family)
VVHLEIVTTDLSADAIWAMSGRTAVITGGSAGIGLAISKALSDAGAAVTIVGRDPQRLESAASQISGSVNTVVGDVCDASTAEMAMRAAGDRVDVLVNNAGGPPRNAPMMTMPIEDFDRTLELNVRAPLLWTRAAWNHSMRHHGGVVLNLASLGGVFLPRKMGAYATAKAAVLHLTRVLAAELAPRIRVNALAPGVIRTQATARVPDALAAAVPLRRHGEPQDAADAAMFLLSDLSRWITGETLVLDGGTLVAPGQLADGWDNQEP